MKIHEYTIADLREFHEGTRPWPWPEDTLPITKQRIYAHINNPRADENDVALLVGYKEDEVISYLGVLPDLIFLGEEPIKLGWLTTWWIKPGNAGSGSLFLLMRAIKLYSGRIGVSEYSESAATIYTAMKNKFKVITPRTIGLWHVRPDLRDRLVTRYGGNILTRTTGSVANTLIDVIGKARTALWARRQAQALKETRFEYVGALDDDTRQFLSKRDRSNELFQRGPRELSWLIHYPWALLTPLQDQNHGRYWFTSNSRESCYLTIRLLREDGSIGGLLILSFRNGLLKVPYSFLDDDLVDSAATLICKHIDTLGARALFLLDERLKVAIKNQRYPCFIHKEIPRNSLFTVDIGDERQVYMHDGDGDCAFT